MLESNITSNIIENETNNFQTIAEDSIGEASILDEESSSEEEDCEPKLKYARIEQDVNRLLNRQFATCFAVHPKFLALGTDWGMIHILDHQGNNICDKNLPFHTSRVNQISIDDNGDYLASSSDDGRVVINGLFSNEYNYTSSENKPIKSVAIDPTFYKPFSSKAYVYGKDDKLILYEKKGLMNRYHSSILHEGEGTIRSIKWKGTRFAWTSNKLVRVYDMELRCRISTICKDNERLSPDLYPCRLFWKDDRSLLVGWGERIKLAIVKDEKVGDRFVRSMYLAMTIDIEYYVCGISILSGNNAIVILSWLKPEFLEDESQGKNERAHMIVIEQPLNATNKDDYVILSDESLSLRGYEAYRCGDYHLESLPDENTFYIVTPKDLVIAKERDMDDHVEWLMQNAKYEEAVLVAQKHTKDLKIYDSQKIGFESLKKLIDDRDFEEAARLSVRILDKDKNQWKDIFYKFFELKQIAVIAPYIPICDPQLSQDVYELILSHYLETDIQRFQTLIEDWPSHLYNIESILNLIDRKLIKEGDKSQLLECMARLYEKQQNFSKALDIYLTIKNKLVFSLIRKHSLLSSVGDKLLQFFSLNADEATKMLLENYHSLTKADITDVYKQLCGEPKYLHTYLHQLFIKDKDIGKEYHDEQVKLYSEFDKKELMQFLRNSKYLNYNKALKICQENKLHREVVYILKRMGSKTKALEVIINSVKSVEEAIVFCKEENEKDLWQTLMNYASDKCDFITKLLHNVGSHVDPIFIIETIKPGMQIPGLQNSLVKLLQDYNLQSNLRRGCRNILVKDTVQLLHKLFQARKRSTFMGELKTCGACSQSIIKSDIGSLKDVILFNCKHVFHKKCLSDQFFPHCSKCSSIQNAKLARRLTEIKKDK